ncbi:MAG: mitochondrial fission ELM1 family protein [Campylobacterales bacterium]|nr:mitochondrial fission ELM1 family protein [Thiotrichales bacterium]MBD3841896.1 mitochondrial fission ELM1 family protein [Campylobacterales bacterium]
MKKAIILSDGKNGHLNQSIAFCKYMDLSYDIAEVRFKNRSFKSLSYLFDRVGFYTMSILDMRLKCEYDEFCHSCFENYDILVCAGSGTYYAAKTIVKKTDLKAVSMMLPHGYRYDFDIIFAQAHDNPPKRSNIIEIPANFSFIQPLGIYKPNKRSVGIIIGGSNSYLHMSKEKLKEQLDFIKERFKDHEIAVTTSPRTSKEIEEFIKSYHFDYEVIYSKSPINPIPDFLAHCDTVFITSDSTSMISESISFGEANIVVLPLAATKENKFDSFISKLEKEEYLHIFNGTIINKNKKIDFRRYLKGLK